MSFLDFIDGKHHAGGLLFEVTRELYGAFEGTFGGAIAAACVSAARPWAEHRDPVSLDCQFLRNLTVGPVRVVPEVVRTGRSLSVLRIDVLDHAGKVAAIATASFAASDVLAGHDDGGMVRPGASVTYAEATPFALRTDIAPIVGTLAPRVKLTDPGLHATVMKVPWPEPVDAAEAACLAADLSVGPPVATDLKGTGIGHPNPNLSLRFTGGELREEVAGVTRVERIGNGVATVRIEVFSGIDLLAVGAASSLLLPSTAAGTTAHKT